MTWTVEENVKVLVAGVEKEVSPNVNFVETIKRLAKEAGITKFNVYVDGENINPADAPATFEGLTEVKIVPYGEVG